MIIVFSEYGWEINFFSLSEFCFYVIFLVRVFCCIESNFSDLIYGYVFLYKMFFRVSSDDNYSLIKEMVIYFLKVIVMDLLENCVFIWNVIIFLEFFKRKFDIM